MKSNFSIAHTWMFTLSEFLMWKIIGTVRMFEILDTKRHFDNILGHFSNSSKTCLSNLFSSKRSQEHNGWFPSRWPWVTTNHVLSKKDRWFFQLQIPFEQTGRDIRFDLHWLQKNGIRNNLASPRGRKQ